TFAWALAHRGEVHQQAGRYDEAVADLTAALELDPTFAWALGTRGEVHQQAGRYDEAVADLTAALEINPTDAWTLSIRGRVHRQAGHFDKARGDLERGVEVQPEDLSCKFEKLMLDTVEGRLASCTEEWSHVLGASISPPDGDSSKLLDLFRALLLDPEDRVAEVVEALLTVELGLGDIAEITSYLTELSAAGEVVADRARHAMTCLSSAPGDACSTDGTTNVDG
ncbi:tetratricopeptide repeat protein, partial [Streptomyces sp. NPDC056361]|uniref:tetratricopeptide repeat protein n=1 Tax=Streptomyces sp. NPDC056361 TaxID=3345795 RepID=UPI0035D69190